MFIVERRQWAPWMFRAKWGIVAQKRVTRAVYLLQKGYGMDVVIPSREFSQGRSAHESETQNSLSARISQKKKGSRTARDRT